MICFQVSEGDRQMRIRSNGWTAVTVDKSQKEHTVLVTDTGVEVLAALGGLGRALFCGF